ncbi:GPR1/FUN34/yaaH family-domain-containing protein [Fusarium redolens]|uniref:GPR1/FUN34/yaaH family-domain-containing protein n=1 Tax=Fusarium redolens TaxID=48865 RepID=A0A9P9G8C5_FUSRE|nr:GPR1/FUN34/yaaH family-domain-containing protein [Fusarium redolens]KAH7233867.1 GPR1/FUN34/yaaH family-domain-containing protein [Fusarium redolens]
MDRSDINSAPASKRLCEIPQISAVESRNISPESLRNKHAFGNPTPIALGGFVMCTTPLSMILLGWEGAGGLGAANVGTYFYLGGLLLLLGGVGGWILGNTFPAVVFCQFGGFWFAYGATLVPGYGAYGAYSVDANNPAEGLKESAFFATFAFFLFAMALLCVVFFVASIRTNVLFFLIFLLLIPTFCCLAGAFFHLSHGNTGTAATLQKVGAGILLAVSFLACRFPIRSSTGRPLKFGEGGKEMRIMRHLGVVSDTVQALQTSLGKWDPARIVVIHNFSLKDLDVHMQLHTLHLAIQGPSQSRTTGGQEDQLFQSYVQSCAKGCKCHEATT